MEEGGGVRESEFYFPQNLQVGFELPKIPFPRFKLPTDPAIMDSVSRFHQIPSSSRSTSSDSTVRSSVRSSRPDGELRQKLCRTVSWSPHIEVWLLASRSVSWNTHVEVFVIPARVCAPDDYDLCSEITTKDRAPDDCDLRITSLDDDQRITSCEDKALEDLETNLDGVGKPC